MYYHSDVMDMIFVGLAIFCFVHIVRDILQIKYGYSHWFLRIGHVWHSTKHEVHGIIIFAVLGSAFLYLGLR